jgi:D-amino peptidase
MKVYLMTDLEGVAGVLDLPNWCVPEGKYYEKARELLAMEINAAIEGFMAGGATEFLVADGHGPGAINPEQLCKNAQVSRYGGSLFMDTEQFDVLAFVGQHPMAGTVGGHLCHTGNLGVVEQTINGIVVGEYGDLVLTAGQLGIRTIFASGCEAFCREARALVPGVETVAVKRGTQTTPGNHLPKDAYRQHNKSAIHIHPEEARKRIKAGAQKAIERAQKEVFGLPELPNPPYTRIRIMRGDSQYPPRILRQSHPASLLEMRREPVTLHELEINPAESTLRKLTGKRIS